MTQAPLPPAPPLPAGGFAGAHSGPPTSRGGMSKGTKWLVGCLVGGCGVVILLMLVGFLVGGAALLRNFSLSTSASLPADFPVYPGAVQQAGFTIKSRDGDAGKSIAMVQWQVAGRGGPVTAWYQEQLNRGDWEIVNSSDSLGRIRFRRRSSGAIASLQVRDQLAQSIIQLAMTGDQPLGRGAHPQSTADPQPGASP